MERGKYREKCCRDSWSVTECVSQAVRVMNPRPPADDIIKIPERTRKEVIFTISVASNCMTIFTAVIKEHF